MTTTPIRPSAIPEVELEIETVGVGAASAWLFGLAVTAATDDVPDEAAVSEIVAAAAGHLRLIEGGYGRGVALIGEFPDDARLQRALRLLSKAMRHCALNPGLSASG